MTVLSGGRVIAVGSAEEWCAMPPHRVIPLMAILVALKDGAETITFEPSLLGPGEVGLKMLYSIAGETYELVPPPAPIAPKMASFVRWMGGIDGLRHRLRQGIGRFLGAAGGAEAQGRFQVYLGDERATLLLEVRSHELGSALHLAVLDWTPGLGASARSFFIRLAEVSPAERFTERDFLRYL